MLLIIFAVLMICSLILQIREVQNELKKETHLLEPNGQWDEATWVRSLPKPFDHILLKFEERSIFFSGKKFSALVKM